MALILWFTAGATSSLVYVCAMDGQTHASCCCSQNEVEADEAETRLERADGCCEVRAFNGDHPPATVEADHASTHASLLAILSPPLQVDEPATQEARLAQQARGPPHTSGPPLFVLHCSYLI